MIYSLEAREAVERMHLSPVHCSEVEVSSVVVRSAQRLLLLLGQFQLERLLQERDSASLLRLVSLYYKFDRVALNPQVLAEHYDLDLVDHTPNQGQR